MTFVFLAIVVVSLAISATVFTVAAAMAASMR